MKRRRDDEGAWQRRGRVQRRSEGTLRLQGKDLTGEVVGTQ